MKVQTDISEELNKKLKIYKVKNDLKTLGEAVAQILKKYFEKDKNE